MDRLEQGLERLREEGGRGMMGDLARHFVDNQQGEVALINVTRDNHTDV